MDGVGQPGTGADREAVTTMDRETRIAWLVDHARRPRHRGTLPDADARVARKVAERCQRLLHKKSIVHALSPHDRRVTVSIGAGTIVPDGKADRAGFIKAVDQQLYAAKNNGRDRMEHVQLAA